MKDLGDGRCDLSHPSYLIKDNLCKRFRKEGDRGCNGEECYRLHHTEQPGKYVLGRAHFRNSFEQNRGDRRRAARFDAEIAERAEVVQETLTHLGLSGS